MHYTTIPIDLMDLVAGHEAQDIDYAIEQGLKTLSEEIGGDPVELVNVAHVIVGRSLCVTVLAKPYQPPMVFTNNMSIQDVFERLKERR